MENIELIKFMVSHAEGFELNGDQLIFPESGIETFDEHLLTLRVWELVWYPLLLQRAIEGVNRDLNNPYKINTEYNNIEVYHVRLGLMDGWIKEDIDQAKEAALMYVREQEKTNE